MVWIYVTKTEARQVTTLRPAVVTGHNENNESLSNLTKLMFYLKSSCTRVRVDVFEVNGFAC